MPKQALASEERCACESYAVSPRWIISMIIVLAFLIALASTGCGTESPILTADVPLHLEDHLGAANIVGSEVPADIPEPVVWNFDEPQPDWKPIVPLPLPRKSVKPATVTRTEEGLRIKLTKANDQSRRSDRPDPGRRHFHQLA